MKQKTFYFILFVICIGAFLVRLYKFDAPIADWHSWRQADTAAVGRNFVRLGFDPLRPRYDDLSNIQSGKDNPQGYRMVEFPLYQSIGYGIHETTHLSIEESLRLVSIISSLISLCLIACIVRSLSNELSGLAAAMLFAFLPYSIFYSRTILPEPFMITLSLVAIYATYKGFETKSRKGILLLLFGAFSAGLSMLVKPFAIFLLLPVLCIWLRHVFLSKHYVFTGIAAIALLLIPFYAWRQWIMQFPEGIAVYSWLFNEGNMRFKGAWFRWLFAERIAKLILGYWGVAFVIIGFYQHIGKKVGYLSGLLLGSFLYLSVIARGNIQHDYYQQLLLPIIVSLGGLGIGFMLHQKTTFQRVKYGLLVSILFVLTVGLSWYEIRGYYWINHPEIVEAGIEADNRIPKDAKVIAPYNGDTTFLYQIDRQGWPIGFEIEKKIAQGAQYYITVSPSDANGEIKDLVSRYEVIVRNDRFAIIDLTKPKGEL
jgi:hypothetical protein